MYGRLALEYDEVRRIWKYNFEDLYNIDTQGQVAVYMSGFDDVRRDNYFGGEPIRRTEVEVRWRSLKMGRLQVKMRSRKI